MLARLYSATLHGLQALPVSVEVSVSRGIGYQITGLPSDTVRESLSRIAVALQHAGLHMPRTRLLIHLGPASLPKSGSAFDLPIALGILLATGQMKADPLLTRCLLAGELTLDGGIRAVPGALLLSELAARSGYPGLVCPAASTEVAALMPETRIFPVTHLRDLLAWASSGRPPAGYRPAAPSMLAQAATNDFADVAGQQRLKRAMEIAATGGHHLLMRGFPGSGKSMLARCLPAILPPMSRTQMLEVTKIAGILRKDAAPHLVTRRPFCEVHPSVSLAGLLGGGHEALPGQVTAAHHGVLFMDEFSEYRAGLLEGLRQPLEERCITVARVKFIITYPAAFMLVAAMNPCGCGYHGHPTIACHCSKRALWWHHRKLSGPILDRFDLSVEAEVPEAGDIFEPNAGAESSAVIRERVAAARARQSRRLALHPGLHTNSEVPHALLQSLCPLEDHARRFLQREWDRCQLSMRGIDKILKVARTIADLAGCEELQLAHVAEACSFRFPHEKKPAAHR